MNLLTVSFLVFTLILSGCVSNSAKVESTDIVSETRLSEFPLNKIRGEIALNRGAEQKNIFDEAKGITVNGYRILFTEGNDSVYVVKDKHVLARVSAQEQTIYFDRPEAPVEGTEKVFVTENYIKYKGSKFTFEDYGFDGLDVKYKTGDIKNAESFLNGKKCEYTVVGEMACCRNASNELGGYYFSSGKGWVLSDNPKFKSLCESKKINP